MKYILIYFLSLTTLVLQAQDFDAAKMNQFFDAIVANDKGMGSISIHHAGKEVYSRAIGAEDIESGKKANTETRYRMGSISKTYTATVIMQLVEEGKLALDTKLAKYYPQFENADKIIIQHLLRHRSGLFNYTADPSYATMMMEATDKEALLEKMMSNKNNFEPDQKYEYSNTGYTLLGFIAEDIDGKPLKEIIADRITIPHKLSNTYFGGKIGEQPNEAQSYMFLNTWMRHPETHMSIVQGAGALVATTSDINLFFTKLLTGQIIRPESVEQMKIMKDNYGYALFTFPFGDKQAIGHNGKIDGFMSMAGYFETDSLAITYISNGTRWSTNEIMIGALSIYYGEEYEMPDFKTITLSDDIIEQYLGVYSTPDFPLKITIAKGDGTITAQATGQGAFPLEALGDDQFKFDGAGIRMSFDLEKGIMSFSQAGMNVDMKRE